MTPVVSTIPHDTLVCEVEGLLVANNISGAPLVDSENNLVGIITKSDIVQFDFTGGDPYAAAAWEISTPNIVSVSPESTLQNAAKIMVEKNVHRLIVVEDGVMQGVISSLDYVKLIASGVLC